MKFIVYGLVQCQVTFEVEAENKEEAIDVADEEFGGISSYVGNRGNDKLIGVSGSNETIECFDDRPEWDSEVEEC